MEFRGQGSTQAGVATLGPSDSLALQRTFSSMSFLFGGAVQLSPANWAFEEDTVQAIIFRRQETTPGKDHSPGGLQEGIFTHPSVFGAPVLQSLLGGGHRETPHLERGELRNVFSAISSFANEPPSKSTLKWHFHCP